MNRLKEFYNFYDADCCQAVTFRSGAIVVGARKQESDGGGKVVEVSEFSVPDAAAIYNGSCITSCACVLVFPYEGVSRSPWVFWSVCPSVGCVCISVKGLVRPAVCWLVGRSVRPQCFCQNQ